MDNRKSHWENQLINTRSTNERIKGILSNTFFYIIKLKICVIYFHSAVGKLSVSEWLDGTAPYYWFNHPVFGMSNWLKPIINTLLTNSYVTFIISWTILLFELILAAAIFIEKKYYKKLFCAAIVFHFLVVIVHGLFSFFFAMAGALCLYFLIEYKNKKYEK